jgi:hypothetical protein
MCAAPHHHHHQAQADPSRSAALYEALKDDAELAPVFEDVKANGPAALQK